MKVDKRIGGIKRDTGFFIRVCGFAGIIVCMLVTYISMFGAWFNGNTWAFYIDRYGEANIEIFALTFTLPCMIYVIRKYLLKNLF